MTLRHGPASALMMFFFLSGVSFLPALVQPEAPPPLAARFLYTWIHSGLDPFKLASF